MRGPFRLQLKRALLAAAAFLVVCPGFCRAQLSSTNPYGDYTLLDVFEGHYDRWLKMVEHTHDEEQPDWMTSVLTIVPTLQQEVRTDYGFSFAPHNLQTFTYASKGTEIIPTENTELVFGNPTYMTRNLPANRDSSGWADWPFLFKYRLLSSPSDAGNYAVTFMLGASFATGSKSVSRNHDFFSPMIAFGKGIKTRYGEFDYQATIGPSVPDGETGKIGTPVTWNGSVQYGNRFHIGNWAIPLWPEFETSWVSLPNGENRGQQQLYLMPGIVAGRFRLSKHAYLVLGFGYQFAVTHARTFNHQWLVTVRIPFF